MDWNERLLTELADAPASDEPHAIDRDEWCFQRNLFRLSLVRLKPLQLNPSVPRMIKSHT